MRRILRGYGKRSREMWGALRWHAYNIMCAMPYVDLKKGGIYTPQDLIRFPWEDEGSESNLPTDEEVNEMRRQIQAENERNKAMND